MTSMVCPAMIVDSPALPTTLFAEPDGESYAVALDAVPSVRLSATNFVEAAARVDMGRNPIASDAFDDLLREARVTIEPVTAKQIHRARRAYRTYGCGGGSLARLNLGDCFASALAAAATDCPLIPCLTPGCRPGAIHLFNPILLATLHPLVA